MPVMDGREAVRRLKADPETASVPVAAVTGQDDPPSRIRDGGFCAHVRKPVVPRDLVRAVELCLEGVAEGKSWIDLAPSAASPGS